jgi:hypothetical protein
MTSSSVRVDDDLRYGLGWWLQQDLNGFRGLLAQGGTRDATAYLQLIPSEDIAVAMLWNTGTPDASKFIDQILSILLPKYQENLNRHHPATAESSASLQNVPPSALIGTWSGSIQTYKEGLPLLLSISASGKLTSKLGSQSESVILRPEFSGDMVKWRMPGPRGLGDTGIIPYELDIKLYAYGAVLAGAARTQPSSGANGASLFYAVKLLKH